MPPSPADRERKKRIIRGLRGRRLEQAIAEPDLREAMEAEANSDDPKKLVTPELLDIASAADRAPGAGRSLSLFFSIADVIIVPGFLASQLSDSTGGNGLIWIDPELDSRSGELLDLELTERTD